MSKEEQTPRFVMSPWTFVLSRMTMLRFGQFPKTRMLPKMFGQPKAFISVIEGTEENTEIFPEMPRQSKRWSRLSDPRESNVERFPVSDVPLRNKSRISCREPKAETVPSTCVCVRSRYRSPAQACSDMTSPEALVPNKPSTVSFWHAANTSMSPSTPVEYKSQ